jgi:hypothetical protein
VVGNLVDNALDAAAGTPADRKPRVDVLVTGADGGVVVQVSDSRPGVADADAVFRQGFSTKVSHEDGGRGFGLALTRLVCRWRGGDVELRNDGGAVFTATLPAADVRRALPGGIVHYLMKPFSYDDLRVRLEHYQQAYAAMEGDHTDQADIDRVFNMTPSDKPLPRGSVPRRSSWWRRRFATATRPRVASRRRRQPACSVSRG